MESSAGPISAEQLKEILAVSVRPDNGLYDFSILWLADELNALIAPLIQAARAEAAAEMRERCARIADGDDRGDVGRLAALIRALPLPPAEESSFKPLDGL